MNMNTMAEKQLPMYRWYRDMPKAPRTAGYDRSRSNSGTIRKVLKRMVGIMGLPRIGYRFASFGAIL